MWLLKLGTVAILFVFPLKGVGMEKFAGQWEMTSMTFGVKVESWGENCGPRPISYTSKKVRHTNMTIFLLHHWHFKVIDLIPYL